MDARITKPRLANLLSYDWLKIVIAIAAAVLAICVFFTTVKTRPGKFHVFTVYGYRELNTGASEAGFMEKLLETGAFSYDVLVAEQETFGTGQYSGAAFSARRAAGQGTVMFLTTNRTDEDDPSKTVATELLGGENHALALDLDVYMSDCENYLIRFFGEKWREGTLDKEEAEKCFLKRNEKDRRYRKQEKKEEGISDEYARLEKLRTDYVFVRSLVEDGTLPFVEIADQEGKMRPKAFSLSALTSLRDYYYYTETTDDVTVASSANICMMIFRNDSDAGKPAYLVENDLRYEVFSYLRALVENFGA